MPQSTFYFGKVKTKARGEEFLWFEACVSREDRFRDVSHGKMQHGARDLQENGTMKNSP